MFVGERLTSILSERGRILGRPEGGFDSRVVDHLGGEAFLLPVGVWNLAGKP